MSSLFNHMDPDYQDKVVKKWSKVLDIPGKEISNEYTRIATAMVLENTEADGRTQRLTEAWSGDGMSAGNTNSGGGVIGTDNSMSDTAADARIPSIVIPTVRRVFPELLAHEVVGVQPMNAPIGFAFAFRAKYDVHGQFQSSGSHEISAGAEIGYNKLDATFTGASGVTTGTNSGAYWQAYAGLTRPAQLPADLGNLGVNSSVWYDGQGASLANSEWAKIGTDMPMAKFSMEKAVVEAKTRKLAAHWSLELAEDMKKMHGLDVDSEMVNIISYEINAEIDRQLVTEMVMAAINAGNVSTWTPVSADGRSQLERLGTLYTHVLDKSQDVAIRTRRGSANFAIASPKTCALLQRLGDFAFWGADSAKVDVSQVGVAKVGTLRQGGIKVYRDTFAGGNYILLGYKGANPYDSGIIYCPYIPVQLMRSTGPDDFSPRLGARTRYGILNHLFGAGIYYHMIAISNLTSVVLADGNRVFTY